MEVENIDD